MQDKAELLRTASELDDENELLVAAADTNLTNASFTAKELVTVQTLVAIYSQLKVITLLLFAREAE